jgi:cytochrome P450
MSSYTETPRLSSKRPPSPPGPRGRLITGTAREFQQSPLEAMAALVAQYGDAVRFRFFLHWDGFLFRHPEHNKHILQENNQNYTKLPHPSFVILEPLVGKGLLTNDGESWLRQRRLIQPIFHRQRIAEFGAAMIAATENMLRDWESVARAGRPIDLDREMTRLTLEIVGRSLFSMDLTGQAETVGTAFTAVNRELALLSAQPFGIFAIRMPFLPRTRQIMANIRALEQVVARIIADRRAAGGGPHDLLAMLMAARDEQTGEAMSDRQLRDEVMTLLLAGHETTSNALCWTFYLLSEHPAVWEELAAEWASTLADRPPAVDDLPRLPFTRMVLEESLRLFPPAHTIARYAVHADEVGGYYVPPKAVLTLSPYLTHRHPDFWPEPDRFDPHRFSQENVASRPRYAYIPFGGGPRQCIGNNFAMTEAQLVLATIGQRFRPRLVPGHPVDPEPLITLRPRYGMRMTLEPAG